MKSDNFKYSATINQSQKENGELRKNIDELRNAYNKLELTNENLKQTGGNEKVAAATLKQFGELERRYIQTKK